MVFHGFSDWTTYFRPLGVLLFAIETRVFDIAPAPMHLVSLGLHLGNVLLVGVFARCLLAQFSGSTTKSALPYAAMLIFGLHPALVEPVAWISSQFDLLVTFFALLGLIANLTVQRVSARAASVALCFFFAACSKETAVSFPLLLLILDWVCPIDDCGACRAQNGLIRRLQRQWPVYLSVLGTGIVYLLFRSWALGFLVNPYTYASSALFPQLQMVCFTYLTYWKMLVWPMIGLAPIHIVSKGQFAEFDFLFLATDLGTLALLCGGSYLLWKRKPLGGLIIAVSVALLPVLHIVPVDFDDSLYHERYAMMAIAMACSFLPSVLVRFAPTRIYSRRILLPSTLVAMTWLLGALINIRVILPLWSDEVRLWQWALLKNPGSITAEKYLFTAYLQRNDLADAAPLAEILMNDGRTCADCMLNVAYLAVTKGQAERATVALREAKKDIDAMFPAPRLIVGYILLSGDLHQLQHDVTGAEEAYRAAIAFDSASPRGYRSLALLLARQGRLDGAREAERKALSLYAPDERVRHEQEFEHVAAGVLSTRPE